MANSQMDVILNVKMQLNDVQAGVNKISNAFKGIKLPQNLQGQFTQLTTKLGVEIANLQEKLSKGITGKSDLSNINKDFKDVISDFEKLNGVLGKTKALDLSKIIKFDSTQAATIENSVKSIDELQQKLENLSKGGAVGATGAAEAISKVVTALEQLQAGSANSKDLGDAIKSLTNTQDIDAAKSALESLIATYTQASKIEKAESGKSEKYQMLNNTVKELKGHLESLNKIHLNSDIDKYVEKIKELQQVINDIQAGRVEEAAKILNGINLSGLIGQVREMGQSVNNAGQSMLSMGAQMDRLKSRIAYFFGIENAVRMVKRALQDAYNTVKELDAAMTEIAVVSEYDVSDMWKQLPEFTDQANRLGSTIKDVYAATTLYVQQGMNLAQAQSVANETLKMARIAGLDAAAATDAMTAALRGFNMELNATSAQRINDVYSKLAAITASDTEEISTAMTKTASIASNAGMAFETTAAFLSQIIETTRESAETAGTAMKTVIARFTELKKNPNDLIDVEGETVDANKIETALRSVGVALRDANGEFRALDDVFLDLASRWDTLSTNQQRYVATMAAGSRQQSRFIAMMSNYEHTLELVDAANNSAGASEEQFGKTLDSLESKLNKLKNAWDEFTMGIANSSLIKRGVDLLTTILTIINKITSAFGEGTGGVLKFAAALSAIKVGGLFAETGVASIASIANGKGPVKLLDVANSMYPGQSFTTKRGAIGYAAASPFINLFNTGKSLITGNKMPQGILDAVTDFKSGKTAFKGGGFTKAVTQAMGLEKATPEIKAFTKEINNGANITEAATKAGLDFSKAVGKEGAEAGKSAGLIGKFVTALGGAGPAIAVVGVAVAAAAIAFAAWYTSIDQQIKRQEEFVSQAQKAASDAKEAYKNLLEDIDTHSNLLEAVENCTSGTQEFTQALIDANAQAIKLLNTYAGLGAGMQVDENGLITFTKDALNQVKDDYVEAQTDLAATAIRSQADLAELQAKRVEQRRDEYKAANYDSEGGTGWRNAEAARIAMAEFDNQIAAFRLQAQQLAQSAIATSLSDDSFKEAVSAYVAAHPDREGSWRQSYTNGVVGRRATLEAYMEQFHVTEAEAKRIRKENGNDYIKAQLKDLWKNEEDSKDAESIQNSLKEITNSSNEKQVNELARIAAGLTVDSFEENYADNLVTEVGKIFGKTSTKDLQDFRNTIQESQQKAMQTFTENASNIAGVGFNGDIGNFSEIIAQWKEIPGVVNQVNDKVVEISKNFGEAAENAVQDLFSTAGKDQLIEYNDILQSIDFSDLITASEQVENYLENGTDAAKRLAEALTGADHELASAGEQLRWFFEEGDWGDLQDNLSDYVDEFGNWDTDGVTKARNKSKQLNKILRKTKLTTKQIIRLFNRLGQDGGKAIKGLTDKVLELLKAFDRLEEDVASLMEGINAIEPSTNNFRQGFENILDVSNDIKESIEHGYWTDQSVFENIETIFGADALKTSDGIYLAGQELSARVQEYVDVLSQLETADNLDPLIDYYVNRDTNLQKILRRNDKGGWDVGDLSKYESAEDLRQAMLEFIPPNIADAIMADIAARGSNFQFKATEEQPHGIEQLSDYILGKGRWEGKRKSQVLTNDELYSLMVAAGEYSKEDLQDLRALLFKKGKGLYTEEGYDFNQTNESGVRNDKANQEAIENYFNALRKNGESAIQEQLAKGDLKDYAKYADALNMNVNDLVTAMEDTREAALSFGDMSAEDVAKILAKDYTKDGKVDYEKFINDYAAKESEGVFAIQSSIDIVNSSINSGVAQIVAAISGIDLSGTKAKDAKDILDSDILTAAQKEGLLSDLSLGYITNPNSPAGIAWMNSQKNQGSGGSASFGGSGSSASFGYPSNTNGTPIGETVYATNQLNADQILLNKALDWFSGLRESITNNTEAQQQNTQAQEQNTTVTTEATSTQADTNRQFSISGGLQALFSGALDYITGRDRELGSKKDKGQDSTEPVQVDGTLNITDVVGDEKLQNIPLAQMFNQAIASLTAGIPILYQWVSLLDLIQAEAEDAAGTLDTLQQMLSSLSAAHVSIEIEGAEALGDLVTAINGQGSITVSPSGGTGGIGGAVAGGMGAAGAITVEATGGDGGDGGEGGSGGEGGPGGNATASAFAFAVGGGGKTEARGAGLAGGGGLDGADGINGIEGIPGMPGAIGGGPSASDFAFAVGAQGFGLNFADGYDNHPHPGIDSDISNALVGEVGPELVQHGASGGYNIVGTHGPELVNLQKGDIVYPTSVTKRILSGQGGIMHPARGRIGVAGATGFGLSGPSFGWGNDPGSGVHWGASPYAGGDDDDDDDDDEWENPYDWLYNLTEDINELIRERNILEKKYDILLKNGITDAGELYRNMREQVDLLERESRLQEQMVKLREQEMRDYLAANKNMAKYGTYNFEDQTIEINWDAIDAVTDSDQGDEIEKYISKLEDIQDSMDEAKAKIYDIEESILDLTIELRKDSIDFENRIIDALVKVQQEEIDRLVDINDSVNDANKQLIDSINKSLDKQRQDRDNEKKEEEIADKQARLAYLKQDTSGANRKEIMDLEKEIAEMQEDYTDTLIDQKISELQDQNDYAAEQRQKQIDLLQSQLDAAEKYGAFNQDAATIIASSLGPDGELVENSQLQQLLQYVDIFGGMSDISQEDWTYEMRDGLGKMGTYLAQFYQLEKDTTSDVSGMEITFIDSSGDRHTGTVDSNGNVSIVTGSQEVTRHRDNTVEDDRGIATTTSTWSEIFQDANGIYRTYEDAKTTTDTDWYYLSADAPKKKKKSSGGGGGCAGCSGSCTGTCYGGCWGTAKGKSSRTGGGTAGLGQQTMMTKAQGVHNASKSEIALIGEKGPEIHQTANGWYLASSPQVAQISKGDTVYTAKETKEILSGKNKKYPRYAEGLATKNLHSLADTMSTFLSSGSITNAIGDNYYDIKIEVDSLASDYDVEKVADKIKRMIVNDSRYRNTNAINRIR